MGEIERGGGGREGRGEGKKGRGRRVGRTRKAGSVSEIDICILVIRILCLSIM